MKEVLLEKLSHVLTTGKWQRWSEPSSLASCLRPSSCSHYRLAPRQRARHWSCLRGGPQCCVTQGFSRRGTKHHPGASYRHSGYSSGERTRCRVGPVLSQLNFFKQKNSRFLSHDKRDLTYKTHKVCLTGMNWFYKIKCILFTIVNQIVRKVRILDQHSFWNPLFWDNIGSLGLSVPFMSTFYRLHNI